MLVRKVLLALPLALGLAVAVAPAAHATPGVDFCDPPQQKLGPHDETSRVELGARLCLYRS